MRIAGGGQPKRRSLLTRFSPGDRFRFGAVRGATRWRGSRACWTRVGPNERPNSWQPDKELGKGRLRFCVREFTKLKGVWNDIDA